MNNIAISPKIFMYALQNQNVERKIAKQIDIKHLQKKNDESNGFTSIEQLTNPEENKNFYTEIPDILLSKEEPEEHEDFIGETFINNDNIKLITQESPLGNSVVSSNI